MIVFGVRGSVRCLHFVHRYYSTVMDLHCSRSKMEWKSLLSRVGGQYDGHAVPKGLEWPCRDPGTGGGVPEASRDARGSKNRFWKEIAVHFG